jgi:hypothetical protein
MKKIDDLLWETFKKSGQTGYYMLYKALNKNQDEKE